MRLTTLGGLALDGSAFTRPKPLLLLAFLALEGPREKRHVAELFWPDAKNATRSLNVALTQLRNGAPGTVQAEERTLTATVPSDARSFLEAIEAGALDDAEGAYRGAFLRGVHVAAGVELEEWLFGTREFLAAHARAVLLERAEADAADGHPREAAARAERAWTLPGAAYPEPRDLERIHTLLLAGEHPRAREVRSEAKEFGAALPDSPAAARHALAHRIGTATAGRITAVSDGAAPFVGRTHEARTLVDALRDGERLLSLLGPPGVGKTRLARHCATRLARSDAFDEIHVVSLEAARDEQQMLRTISAALRPDAEPAQNVPQLAGAIGEGRVLLVLDNFEQLAEAAGDLADLLASCANLQLLVTSRERLHVQEEQAHIVNGLPLPAAPVTPAEAPGYGAVRLFVERARRAHPGFTLDEATLPDVLDVCRLVDGLPLGLELAAAWLRMMPVAGVATELARNLDLLESRGRDVPERHRSLRNAFDGSWALLSSEERAVFTCLAVFRGGFRREAAQAVAGATLPVLASLVDKSLVQPDPPDRYRLHPLLAQVGRERLSLRADAEDCAHRHAEHFLALAETAPPHLTGPDPGPWLRRLDAEHTDLHVALDWLEAHDLPRAMRFASALWRYWIVRGHNREGRERLERLVTARGAEAPTPVRATLLQALGTLTFQTGDFARAGPHVEEALAIARTHGDEPRAASILNGLAWIEVHLGETRKGLRHGTEALSLNRRLGDVRGVALAQNELGFRAVFLGDFAVAREHLAESLRTFEELGDERGVAHLRTNLALVHVPLGAFEEAQRLLDASLATLTRIGDKQLRVWCLYQRACCALAEGRHADADVALREALPLAEEVGNRELLGAVHTATADLRAETDAHDLAAASLAQARAAWRSAGYPWMWALTHRVAAHAADLRGDVADARSELCDALALSERIEDRYGLALGLEQAALLDVADAPQQAARLLGASEALRSALRAPVPPRTTRRLRDGMDVLQRQLDAKALASARQGGRAADAHELASAWRASWQREPPRAHPSGNRP